MRVWTIKMTSCRKTKQFCNIPKTTATVQVVGLSTGTYETKFLRTSFAEREKLQTSLPLTDITLIYTVVVIMKNYSGLAELHILELLIDLKNFGCHVTVRTYVRWYAKSQIKRE